MLLTVALCFATAAQAQQSDAKSATAKASDASILSGDAPRPEHALGDWGGFRTRLADAGVDLKFGYLNETIDIASGGVRQGIDYAHQIKLQGDIDAQTLLGLKGWSAHFTLLERAGRNASADYLHDDLVDVQEIYGSTAHAAAHLGQFYAEHAAGDQVSTDIKVGRLPVGADFAWSPLYCQFVSLGLCPQPRALSLNGDFSVDPSSTWAGRVRIGSTALYGMIGAYQVRPRYGGPSGFDWGTSHTTGAIFPVELGWTPRFGADALQGHYKIGFSFDTSNAPNLAPDGPERHQRLQFWILADQMLIRTGKDGMQGLILLGGWSHGDPTQAILRDFAFGGLSAAGLIRSRPADTIQFMVDYAAVSHRLTAAQIAALDAGTTLPTGFPPAPGSFAAAAAAPGIQTHEWIAELNYGVHLHDGVVLTPDVQFIGRPGAVKAISDALAVGGRFEVNF